MENRGISIEEFEEAMDILQNPPKEPIRYIPARGRAKILTRVDTIEDLMKELEDEEDGKDNECSH